MKKQPLAQSINTRLLRYVSAHRRPGIITQRMKKYLDLVFSLIISITAYQFYPVWIQGLGPEYLRSVAYSTEERPYVYRVLLPLLSRFLEALTGISAVYLLVFLFIVCSVVLYFSLKYLYASFRDDERAGIIAFIICEILFVVLLSFPHVYDLPAAMFFTLGLALIARGKHLAYLLLFPVATLNRETTFLLSIVWLVISFRKVSHAYLLFGTVYQGVVYLAIRTATTIAFANNPGQTLDWQPMYNLVRYGNAPISTTLLLAFLAFIWYAAVKGWNDKPLFLRTAFLILFPLQIILHVTLGGAFEVRVYAESLPLAGLLIMWNSTKTTNADLPNRGTAGL